jgi:hypothetical protein
MCILLIDQNLLYISYASISTTHNSQPKSELRVAIISKIHMSFLQQQQQRSKHSAPSLAAASHIQFSAKNQLRITCHSCWGLFTKWKFFSGRVTQIIMLLVGGVYLHVFLFTQRKRCHRWTSHLFLVFTIVQIVQKHLD